MRIINEWMRVPVVKIVYSGPKEFQDELASALEECGIFEGSGSPLFVRVDTDGDLLAIWMRLDEREWDNYTSLTEASEASMAFKNALENLVGCTEFPKEGFKITFSVSGVEATPIVGATPVVFEFEHPEYHEIVLDGEATTLKRGFHEIEGIRFFAGRDDMRIDTAKFFPNAEIVFPSGEGFVKLVNGRIRGRKVLRTPIGIWNDLLIYSRWVIGGKTRELRSTAVDVFEGTILEADGSLEDVEGGWRTKISCTPLEWCWRKDRLCLLDACGIYREVDLKTKRVVFEKGMPGAVGFDYLNGKVVEVKGENFCVVKGTKVFGECVRLHNGYALKIEDGRIEILGRGLSLNGNMFRMINGFLVIVGDDGTWVVSFGK